jgi:hypothetical protein
MLNLYLISQSANNDYDTYDAAVVCAENEDDAKSIHPGNYKEEVPLGDGTRDADYGTWTCRENVRAELIGAALNNAERGVVLASFNAG